MGSNGRNIIHNYIYDMEEKYDQELDKLYEKYNVSDKTIKKWFLKFESSGWE